MPFEQGTEVEVRAIDASDWIVLRPIRYFGARQTFEVPVGMCTDFASVPRAFVWFLPRYGAYTKAAILHDYLWRVAVPRGDLSLPEADGIFRRAMRELHVPFLRRWIMWSAVRLGALMKRGGRKQWARDSWLVAPVALLAIPILIAPAIFIVLALAVWFVVEEILYLPLAIAHSLRARVRLSVKAVTPPNADWTTN
jgi:hypothetical protein